MPRNPKWTRDELILALDLYLRVDPLRASDTHPEIVKLSQLLNKLPIHSKTHKDENFRNPSGVYMKLCNFLSLDPNYEGVGLKAGSKLDKIIWNEFYGKLETIVEISNAIKSEYVLLSRPRTAEEEQADQDEEFPEGRIVSRLHRIRERSGSLPAKKKKFVLAETDKLECEACGFDFFEKYGDMGKGFAECHHNKPISSLSSDETTKLSDLSILCSNCHRMIHRTRPWLTVNDLKKEIY